MARIRFDDLTPEQYIFLQENGELNGCGPKTKWIPIPDWIFTTNCDHHDFNYWLGHNEADRLKADYQFYESMWENADSLPWYKRWAAKSMAWTYYQFVKLLGKPLFHYADEERTLEDLEELMNASE